MNPTHFLKQHILHCVVAFLLLGALCAAPAAAADIAFDPAKGYYQDGIITPDTSLSPGQKVSATFKIYLPKGSVSTSDSFKFSSPLERAEWKITVYGGLYEIGSMHSLATVSGTSTPKKPYKPNMFDLCYSGRDITLLVSVTGTVSEMSAGTSINVLDIQCSRAKIGSYLSPVQKVSGQSSLNPGDNTQETPAPSLSHGEYQDVIITPSEELQPGQKVSATFKIYLPEGSVSRTDTFSFGSPLKNALWDITVYRGKADANTEHYLTAVHGDSTPNSPFRPNMFNFYYSDQAVTLIVSLNGTVPQTAAGSFLSVIQVSCSSQEIGSYLSPAQLVEDPNAPKPEEPENNTTVPETPSPTPTPTPTTPPVEENTKITITIPSISIVIPFQPPAFLSHFFESVAGFFGLFF